ncbi:MAG: DUF4397 domain-containing protein, partial [Chitinophagaceae bacterium]|nr:DUF4397 domain-containing protein [Anaerolineae bacterium]
MRSKAFLLTLIWVVFACSLSDVKTNAYSGAAGVRMVHTLVDVESADIYLNDTLIGTVAYGGAAPYMRLNAGDVTVRAFAPGTGPDGVPVFEENFVISDGQHVNVALIGTAAESRLGVYPIDLTPMGDNFGVSHVNLIHAVAGGDPMTVTATDRDGSVTTLVENLAFGASVAFDLPAGSHLLNAGDVLQDVALNGNGDMTFAVFV